MGEMAVVRKEYYYTGKGYYIQLEHYSYSVDCRVYNEDLKIQEFISKDTKEEIEEELLTYFWYGGFDFELGEFDSIEECVKAHKSRG